MWYELSERNRGQQGGLKHKLMKIKELLEDVCYELEDSYGERGGYGERDDYGERDGYGERRGVRGTGRYSRY